MQKLCKCVLFCLGLMSGERELIITREVERDAPPLMCIGWIGSDTSPESRHSVMGAVQQLLQKLGFILFSAASSSGRTIQSPLPIYSTD